MIYFTNGPHTASAECDKRAAALLARGYTRCTCAVWRSARRANDLGDLRRITIEDWLARQGESAPLMRKG